VHAKSASAVDLYGANYGRFASRLYSEIREQAFGEDIGQTGWLTASEQELFMGWLDLAPSHRLLDLACGSGGPRPARGRDRGRQGGGTRARS
jgi:hypothetical protein